MGENEFENPIPDLKNQINALRSEGKWAVACYIPLFGVAVCVVASVRLINSKFVQFHVRQGIVLFAFTFLSILISIFSSAIALMMFGAILLLSFAGMFIALGKKMTAIPVIVSIANMIPEKFLFERLTGTFLDKDSSDEVIDSAVDVLNSENVDEAVVENENVVDDVSAENSNDNTVVQQSNDVSVKNPENFIDNSHNIKNN